MLPFQPIDHLTYQWSGICGDETSIKSNIKATFNNDEAFQSFSAVMADVSTIISVSK